MHVRRGDLDEWIRKLDDRGIKEFQFKDLPDDLKHRRVIQKAKDLGLLRSISITNGRHTWEVVPSNISTKAYKIRAHKIQDDKKVVENGTGNNVKMSKEKDNNHKGKVLKMSLEPVYIWKKELQKRGITTFESRDLPEELRDRIMIIRAKYAGIIIKSKKENSRNTWEVQ